MKVRFVALSLLVATAAWGQEPAEEAPPQIDFAKLRSQAQQLIEATRSLENWDEHYEYIVDAMDRVFDRNDWDSESDVFALEMIREVGSIPPWQPQDRFNAAMQIVSDRYLLDEGQEIALQQLAIKANVELFVKHSDRIMQYGMEALQTRAAGEPFTAEQIQRWTTLAEPVFQDARESMNRYAQEFMEDLDPEQQELLKQDVQAANRRMLDVDRMGQEWKKGNWDPQDWGMEDDPIQNRTRLSADSPAKTAAAPSNVSESPDTNADGAAANPDAGAEAPPPAAPRNPQDNAARPSPPADQAAPAPPTAKGKKNATASEPDDPWARYVRSFIAKYSLNDEQQQRAWLFYRDSKDRDDVFASRYDRQVESVRGRNTGKLNERDQAALDKLGKQRELERDRLFNRLKRRLERLPTRAQRKAAQPAPKP